MTVKTVTVDRLPNQMGMLPGIQAVIVNGERVGTIAKNKHGIWIGNFDRDAFDRQNPFAEARLDTWVRCSIRGCRTKRDVVRDIVNRVPSGR